MCWRLLLVLISIARELCGSNLHHPVTECLCKELVGSSRVNHISDGICLHLGKATAQPDITFLVSDCTSPHLTSRRSLTHCFRIACPPSLIPNQNVRTILLHFTYTTIPQAMNSDQQDHHMTGQSLSPQPAEPHPPNPTVAELQTCPGPSTVGLQIIANKARCLDPNNDDIARAFKPMLKCRNDKGHKKGTAFTLSLDGGMYEKDVPTVPTLDRLGGPPHMHPQWLSKLVRHNMPRKYSAIFCPGLQYQGDADQNLVELVHYIQYEDVQPHRTLTSVIFDTPITQELAKPRMSHEPTASIFPHKLSNAMSIMPRGSTLPLEWSPLTHTAEIHLLSGVRVYFVWPPQKNNISCLYKYLKGIICEELQALTLEELENGITFVQRPGQVVTLPPYCPTMVFATKNSAAIPFGFRHIETLPLRIRYLPLLVHIGATNPYDNCRYTALLEAQVNELYEDLETFLGSEVEAESHRHLVVMEALAAEWDDLVEWLLYRLGKFIPPQRWQHWFSSIPALWERAMHFHRMEVCPMCKWTREFWAEGSARFHIAMNHWQENAIRFA